MPYWLLSLILILVTQVVSSFSMPQIEEDIVKAKAVTPQVLGEATDLRGISTIIQAEALVQASEPDFKAVTAKSFIVFDLASGAELAFRKPEEKLYIASLTKLLTGLVAYQNLDLNQQLEINFSDKLNVPPVLNLAVGDKVKALDVFSAMLVGSVNDAALTLANHTEQATGKKFTDLMNAQARILGMQKSNFSNPTGFDSQYNYSTAKDLKNLIEITQRLAVFKNLGRRNSYSFSGESRSNYSTQATNKLIEQYPDLSAIKTGYTKGAGGAMATKLDYKGHEIVILVLDSKDREEDTLRIRQAVITNFK